MKFFVLIVCLALIFKIEAKPFYGQVRLNDQETVSYVVNDLDSVTKDGGTGPSDAQRNATEQSEEKSLSRSPTYKEDSNKDLLNLFFSRLNKMINVLDY